MYGLIIENIIVYIRENFSDAVWQEVKYVAGIEPDTYNIEEVFAESLPHKLLWACHEVTGKSMEEITNAVGYSFYKFLGKFEFHKIVRVLGRTFPKFLNGLDNLHEYLKFSFPKLKPPSFYCEHESRTGLTLHYRSKRRGFLHYVRGQIKCIGRELFQTDVEIELLDHENDNSMEHVILRLHFNNQDFNLMEAEYYNLSLQAREKIRITSDVFFDIFPFMIVFNRGMRIRNVGIGLLRTMQNLVGKKINHQFVLMRPFIRFRWEEIMLHSNNIFEIMSTDPVFEDDAVYIYKSNDPAQLTEERMHMGEKEKEKFLQLKGQMLYMEEWESICFLGIPVMSNLNQMYKTGLFINDFALHDSSRDLVLASTQQAAELKLLLHQEAMKSQNMTENMVRLKKERRRTDKLLYQLLPRSVAEKLRKGESTTQCCEHFESVSIVFTDIVGFTEICSELTALEVVHFLNDMFSRFDTSIDKHGVFKVETIGDAYMVVSGAPRRTVHHAEYVLDCAASLIIDVEGLDSRKSKRVIRIRVGAHSGPVIAGVVGLRMPRYCLFGETVLIANHMESSGVPMRVHVSERTVKMVQKHSKDFKFIDKSTQELRDGSPLKTYLLEQKLGSPRAPTPTEDFDGSSNDEDDVALPAAIGSQIEADIAKMENANRKAIKLTKCHNCRLETCVCVQYQGTSSRLHADIGQ